MSQAKSSSSIAYEYQQFFFVLRNFDDAVLLIDRAEVNLTQQILRNITQQMLESSNKVFVGGINSTDSRYTIYKSYSGCLSSKIAQICRESKTH